MVLLLTSKLTISESTFVARVLIQILAYAGGFLLGLIVIGHAPRIAHFRTHDLLNRAVGQMTLTVSSFKWELKQFASGVQSNTFPRSFALTAAILLYLIYGVLVSLSDIGLIGFYQCSASLPTYTDYPASVRSDTDAFKIVRNNMILGPQVDPTSVRCLRCDQAQLETHGPLSGCTSWHNSTYADPSFFLELNSTDSDVLMPRQLMRAPTQSSFYTNIFTRAVEGPRLSLPTVIHGIAVVPHNTGVRMIVGVPDLSDNQKVQLPQTLAIEADVGCMALGIIGQENTALDTPNYYTEFFQTTGPWREYIGPDYFYEVLSRYVDGAREVVKPLFETSDIAPDGSLQNHNISTIISQFTFYDRVSRTLLGGFFSNPDIGRDLEANCSRALHEQLMVPLPDPRRLSEKDSACQMLGLSTSVTADSIYLKTKHVLCATSTQVNMVSVTVQRNATGSISLANLVHLPSSLNIVDANYWGVTEHANWNGGNDTTLYNEGDKVVRYTLSEDSSGPLYHPIFQTTSQAGYKAFGAGSAGVAISELGSTMLTLGAVTDPILEYLNGDFYGGNLSVARITEYAGQIGATFLSTSIGYNRWVARNGKSPKLVVESTGGKSATCYRLVYGLAFLPLFIVAAIIMAWVIVIVLGMRGQFALFGRIKSIYGGLAPFASSVVTPDVPTESPLVWEKAGRPHLEFVYDGRVLEGRPTESLADYLDERKVPSDVEQDDISSA